MIGVLAKAADREVVAEFFELFKTPWEFHVRDGRYDVLLCDGEPGVPLCGARVVVVYAGTELDRDRRRSTSTSASLRRRSLSYKGTELPLYGDSVTFSDGNTGLLEDSSTRQPAAYVEESAGTLVARVGYDLFAEIRTLLTDGQPAQCAAHPALELHIDLLCELIVSAGVSLMEIPPVPDGYDFIACLTHDVDHPAIRRHIFDHTMAGFLYRALLGSVAKVLRGHMPVRDLWTNWKAAVTLALVHLGLAEDFWLQFDRFRDLEQGARSTFFAIPFRNEPGRNAGGRAPARRASRYAAADPDIAARLRKLMASGCEIGLHGIDAWCDSGQGALELQQIRRVTGQERIGVRMHWLYFGADSPERLEEAGAAYDSTVGYNENVGFRAGTTQVYKPLRATRLLELPLHVMDTALFYPSHLNLSPAQAHSRVSAIIDSTARFGGVVTFNWHDRSIAPERLWGEFYRDQVTVLRTRGAWMATASQAVRWFQQRRSVVFQKLPGDTGEVAASVTMERAEEVPGLRLRIHKAADYVAGQLPGSREIVDTALIGRGASNAVHV